jgi:hypothetical protein
MQSLVSRVKFMFLNFLLKIDKLCQCPSNIETEYLAYAGASLILGRCYGNIVLVPQIKINERSRCRDHGLPQLIPWPWDQSISARREIIGVVSIVGAAFFVAGIVVIMV